MLSIEEYNDILCDFCRNETIIYCCPFCESKGCFMCFGKHFIETRDKGVKCKYCNGIDRYRIGFVNEEAKL